MSDNSGNITDGHAYKAVPERLSAPAPEPSGDDVSRPDYEDMVDDIYDCVDVDSCTNMLSFDAEGIRKIIRDHDRALLSRPTPGEAPDFGHYWQIVLGWAQDMGTIKKLSVHEMRMLCERLQSITAHALAQPAAPKGEISCRDCDWYDSQDGESCEHNERARCIDYSLFEPRQPDSIKGQG